MSFSILLMMCIPCLVFWYFKHFTIAWIELSNGINGFASYTPTFVKFCMSSPEQREIDKMQNILATLNKNPKCFGSPLYMARFMLKKKIKSKLKAINVELVVLQKKNVKL